jgi:gamma-glutamyltranspeptidase/glutathione hydrolase
LAGFTLASLLLLGCQGRDPALMLDDPRGFLGGVVADEPRAALVGSEILSTGGSAADAAIATYFALGVTLPSRAGISGGGMCLVYDPRLNRVDTLDFFPREAGPAAARGMFALHARSGRLRWEQLVSPAEGLARFGTPISRAFAGDLAESASILSRDPEARRIFLRSNGAPRGEGDSLVQADLATVLAEIRARGPQGLLAYMPTSEVVDARGATGAGVTVDDPRSGAPAWQPSLTVRHDGVVVHFAPSPSAAGASQAQMFTMMAERWRRTPAAERPNLIAEAGLRAASNRGHGGDDPARMAAPSASFAAVDRDGGAVACTVTMNDVFGLGRVVPGTGVVLAAAPRGGQGGETPAPMLALRARSGAVVFVGAASGGWPGAGALVDVALRTIVDGRRLDEAMSAARVNYTGAAGQVLVEGEGPQAGLASRGYAITTVPVLGRVNAIFCPDGLSAESAACQFAADRRGFGLAAGS